MEILETLNWVDFLLVILLIRSTLMGSKIGLTAEFFKLIGTLISILVGFHCYSRVAEALLTYITLPVWLAEFIILILIILFIRVVFKYGVVLFLKVLNIQFVLQLERIGGALIGLGRGLLIGGLLLIVMLLFPVVYLHHSIGKRSFFAPYFIKSTKNIYISIVGLIPSQEPKKIPTIETREGAPDSK